MLRILARCLILMLTLCWATAVQAGAWPRDQGRWFLSTSSFLSSATGWRPSGGEVYVEYGWRPRLTLTSALAWSSGYDRLDLGLRWHPPDLPNDLRWGLTAGVRHAPGTAAPVQAQLGVEFGRGMAIGDSNLWVDAGLRLHGGMTFLGFEVEVGTLARLGLRRDRWIGMMGITHDRNRFASRTRLRPAVGYQWRGLTLVAEGEMTQAGDLRGVQMTLWSEF